MSWTQGVNGMSSFRVTALQTAVPKTDQAMDEAEEDVETPQDIESSMMHTGEQQNTQDAGGYTGSDEAHKYSLFSNPPNLGLMRERLFQLDTTIELTEPEFDTYFPFVDNVWRKNRTGESQKEKNIRTDTYWCRTRRSANYKPQTPKPTPEGKRSRKKRAREDKDCGMEMKVMITEGPNRICTISRSAASTAEHTHDLDYMDNMKRNSGVMEIARREAIRGFLPGSVFGKMSEEPEKMQEAGGKFMKVSDVRNTQYSWRQENLDVVLRDHSGKAEVRTWSRVKKVKTEDTPSKMATKTAPIPELHSPQTLETRHKLPPGTLQYPDHARQFLQSYLPDTDHTPQHKLTRPHVTLTYAQSLDGRISLIQGLPTAISGPETKAMTHYLRSRHDAILVGVRTAIADDPGLNCRLAGSGGYGGAGWFQQPRPIIIDPHARLIIRKEMKMLKLVSEGRAKAPWVVVPPNADLHPVAVSTLKAHRGEYLQIGGYNAETGFSWEDIFTILFKEGIRSIMVEGGGIVLSELLKAQYQHLIDSVIVTVAPSYMGKGGTPVVPDPSYDQQRQPVATKLTDVRWQPMGDQDVVMCGKMMQFGPERNGILEGIEKFGNGLPASQPPQAQQSTSNRAVSATATPQK